MEWSISRVNVLRGLLTVEAEGTSKKIAGGNKGSREDS